MFKPLLLLNKITLALIFLTIPSTSLAAVGALDSLTLSPHWDYQTFETEHFRITYPRPLQELVNPTAQALEDAHRDLSKILRWEPRYKVLVLLLDNQDSANGIAAPAGRIGMTLYMTPPDNGSQLAYYDDWLRLLVYHEYTHMLNIDAYGGIFSFLRNFIFGDTSRPNIYWPTWMIEGLAVYMETQKTRGGRGRSPYYEMVLRAAEVEEKFLSDDFISLDRVNGINIAAPGGETPYLFGYYLMTEVVKDVTENPRANLNHPEDALGLMSIRSSRRIPFFINDNLKNITGKDWYDYWRIWRQNSQTRLQAQLKKIRSHTVSSSRRLTEQGFDVSGLALSPDGRWLVYQQSTPHRRGGLYLRDMQSGKTKRIMDRIGENGMSWTSDSRHLIFGALTRESPYRLSYDIGVYDRVEDEVHWLSHDKGYGEPDLSPDEKSLVFRVYLPGRTALANAPLIRDEKGFRLGKAKILFNPPLLDNVSNPRFLDTNTVVFAHHRNGQFSEELRQLKLQEKKIDTLVADGHFNRYPVIQRGNRGEKPIIYFVSNRSGVDNLYRWEDKSAVQVTNVETGLRFVTFSPQKSDLIYANLYGMGGFDLAEVDINLGSNVVPTGTVTLLASEKISPPAVTAAEKQVASGKTVKGESQSYSIIPSIWPRRWGPVTSFLLDRNEINLGLGILGIDQSRQHEYNFEGGYNLTSKTIDSSLSYSTSFLGPIIEMAIAQRTDNTLTSNNGQLLRYDRDQSALLGLSFPIRRTFSVWLPSFSASFERTLEFDPTFSTSTPSTKGVFVPELSLGLQFNNTESSLLAISPENGRTVFIGARRYLFENGNEGHSHKALINWTEYWRIHQHSILVTNFAVSAIDQVSELARANVSVESTSLGLGRNLTEISLRGYNGVYRSREVAAGALELRVPLLRIYRGWGTLPFFLENIYGTGFFEAVYFPRGILGGVSFFSQDNSLFLFATDTTAKTLMAGGAGLTLEGSLLAQRFNVSLFMNNGLNKDLGGVLEFVSTLQLPGLIAF